MIRVLNYFFPPPKTNVELTIEYIFKYKVNNIFKISPLYDQSFNLGSFVLQFSHNDELCFLKLKGDKVPMFAFSNLGDIFAIRRAIGLAAVSR